MTTLNISISLNTDGAAFEDDPGELGFILSVVAERIAAAYEYVEGSGYRSILDSNGNTIGYAIWNAEAES